NSPFSCSNMYITEIMGLHYTTFYINIKGDAYIFLEDILFFILSHLLKKQVQNHTISSFLGFEDGGHVLMFTKEKDSLFASHLFINWSYWAKKTLST
ncbi:hypothetical protein ACJX0J_020187, partial [Zea mays]